MAPNTAVSPFTKKVVLNAKNTNFGKFRNPPPLFRNLFFTPSPNAYLDLPLRDPLLLLVSGLNKTGHDIINNAPFYSSAYKS